MVLARSNSLFCEGEEDPRKEKKKKKSLLLKNRDGPNGSSDFKLLFL